MTNNLLLIETDFDTKVRGTTNFSNKFCYL